MSLVGLTVCQTGTGAQPATGYLLFHLALFPGLPDVSSKVFGVPFGVPNQKPQRRD